MQDIPTVSVLMPVYNGEQWLSAAIESILLQTYSDFELLILLEYGSNRKSREIIYSYTDRRIKVIENKEKLGLAASLNAGIREAKGKYIARMDADDVSTRERFKKQVAYLERHPDIAICGTNIRKYRILASCWPITPLEVRFFSFNECPFAHPTVMWRRELFLQKELFYREGIEAEDFEFWTRVLDQYKGANIPKPLLMYRLSPKSKSALSKEVLEQEKSMVLEPYWNRHGMQYFAPDDFCGGLGFQNDRIRQQEWRLLELTRKTKAFKGKNYIIRKRFFDIYIPETLQVRLLVKRYNELFLGLYNNSGLARFQIFSYAVYRVIREQIRPLLIRVLGRQLVV